MRLPAFTRIPRRWLLPAGAVLIALALLLTGLALLGARAAEAATPRDFYAASVNGSILTVWFNEHLRPVGPGSSPHPNAFEVTAKPPGGTARTISGFGSTVAVSGTSVTVALDVTDPVREGEALTVSYASPPTNPLQYIDGQNVQNFSGKPVTNETDETKPNVIAAQLNATELILYFDDRMKASAAPDRLAFWIQRGGSGQLRPIGNPRIDGSNTLRIPVFNASSPAKHGETFRFAYTPPSDAANRIQDRSGNQLDAIAQWADIDNQTPPAPSSAAVDGARLVVTFDGGLEEDPEQAPPRTAFRVWRGRSGSNTTVALVTTNPVAVSGTQVTLSLAEAVLSTDTVTLHYQAPTTGGRLRDDDRRELPVKSFLSLGVTNNTPATTAPQFSSAEVNGKWLEVTFNETLQTAISHRPPHSAFTVSAMPLYGTARTIDGASEGNVAISGSTLTVTLASEVERGERVTVSYTKPSSNTLRGTDNNDVGSFSGQPATNNSAGAPAPSFSSASYSYPAGGITVHFDGPYLGCAAARAWRFKLDGGREQSPQVVRCGDRSVLLVLAALTQRPAVEAARSVTVSYNRSTAELEERSTPLYHPPRGSAGPSARLTGTDGSVVASFSDQTVTGLKPRLVPPPTVDGRTLTLTFTEELDPGATPGPWLFDVTVNGDERSVVRDGVAIAGKTVTLTLRSPVAPGDTVTVRYTQPRGCGEYCSWGLRGASHIAVDSFPDQGPPVTIWSATLTVAELVAGGTTYRGCFANNPGKECGDALTTSSFMSGGTDYRVRSLTRTGDNFEFVLDDTAIPQGWTLHIGDHEFSVADATVSGGDNDIAIWTNPGFSWTANQMVSLRLTRPSGASSQAVTNNSAAPVFSSATVVGSTLTLTFDKNLDAGSVPDPGAFRVTANDAFRPIAFGGVAIAGKTVKLTLFRPASGGQTVKVRYTKPSSNPLRGFNGLAVDTFAEQAVTNSTPVTIWSATLTARAVTGDSFGCDDATSAKCSTASTLLPTTFLYASETYQVKAITIQDFLVPNNNSFFFKITLDKVWPQALRDSATLHFGTRQYGLADLSVTDGGKGLGVFTAGLFGISLNQQVSLRLTTTTSSDAGGASGLSAPEEEQVPDVSVTGVSVVSDPGADQTYGIGDTISVQVTFNRLVVDVDTSAGTPRLKIDMDPAEWGEKWARYQSGSGTHSLIFTHTVVEPNISTQGIAVLADTLELNGGTIQSEGADAGLAHTGLAHDANHRVDWQASSDSGEEEEGASGGSGPEEEPSEPPANSAATGAPAITGTARVGETLTANTSGIADADGLTNASFSYQWLADGSGISGATGSTYTLATADVGKAVKVQVSFTDDAGHAETLTSAATAAVAANPPAVTAVRVTSSPGSGDTYGPGEVIRISVTFDEAVDVSGTPQLTIDMDPAEWGAKQAAYEGGSGTKTLTFTHTVAEPNISTQGIAVLANSLALNGGDIESKATDADADLSHTGLSHDSKHKVDWRTPAPTVASVAITSDPGSDDTYALGDVITISVTFSEAVDVTGAPRIAIDMDPAEWGTKQAAYQGGSGTTTLTFTHTVVEPNYSTQGIAVLANTLALNGGDIESKATDADADLSHTGLAHDAGHKVDWQQSEEEGAGS